MALRNRVSDKLLLIISISLGLGLRIIQAFFTVDVDFDEAYVYCEAIDNSYLNLIVREPPYWDYVNPPLYGIFLKFWAGLTGYHHTARIPGVLASVLSIFLVHRIARKVTDDSKTALLIV